MGSEEDWLTAIAHYFIASEIITKCTFTRIYEALKQAMAEEICEPKLGHPVDKGR